MSAKRKNLLHWLKPGHSPVAHHEHAAHCTALCCARQGQSATVLELVGDCAEAARLRDLGVREGATVTVLRDGDPLMVRVEDARFGIGRAAALNVLCTLKDAPTVSPTPRKKHPRAHHAGHPETRR